MKQAVKNFIKNRTNPNKRQRGISIPAMAVASLVAGVTLIGGAGAFKYFGQAKASNEVNVITDWRNATVKYGQSVGTFTTGNTALADLIKLNFFSNPLLKTTATTVTNQWGGTVTVGVGTINTAGDSLVFTVTGVPSDICNDVGLSVDAIAAVVAVNSTSTKAAGASTVPATLATQCASATNTMAFTLAR